MTAVDDRLVDALVAYTAELMCGIALNVWDGLDPALNRLDAAVACAALAAMAGRSGAEHELELYGGER